MDRKKAEFVLGPTNIKTNPNDYYTFFFAHPIYDKRSDEVVVNLIDLGTIPVKTLFMVKLEITGLKPVTDPTMRPDFSQ